MNLDDAALRERAKGEMMIEHTGGRLICQGCGRERESIAHPLCDQCRLASGCGYPYCFASDGRCPHADCATSHVATWCEECGARFTAHRGIVTCPDCGAKDHVE